MISLLHNTRFFLLLLLITFAACNGAPQPGQDAETAQQSIIISGTVKGYAANREGDIDKLLIQTTSNIFSVHFPPHTANTLLTFAGKGTVVCIEAHRRPAGPADDALSSAYELVSLEKEGAAAIIRPRDIHPLPPSTGRQVELSGPFISKNDSNQQQYGFIQMNKLVVLPPHTRQSLEPLLKKAKTISVRGYERDARSGFVNMEGLTVVRPYQVIINGVTYDVR